MNAIGASLSKFSALIVFSPRPIAVRNVRLVPVAKIPQPSNLVPFATALWSCSSYLHLQS
jgi:hypothetical protein